MIKSTLDISIEAFDLGYKVNGIRSQRMYPNESLIQFIAGSYYKEPEDMRKSIRVLEVGCGSGANLWMLSKEGFDVYGVDSSEVGIDLAREHLNKKWNVNANLCKGSFTDLPYDDAFFDVVVDIVSLQHINIADSHLALKEIYRVMKPAGKFFSYRFSDHSDMYEHSGGKRVDISTIDNIADPNQPFANGGPVSFWSPVLTRS